MPEIKGLKIEDDKSIDLVREEKVNEVEVVEAIEEKTVWVCWVCDIENELGSRCECRRKIEDYTGEDFDKILKTIQVNKTNLEQEQNVKPEP